MSSALLCIALAGTASAKNNGDPVPPGFKKIEAPGQTPAWQQFEWQRGQSTGEILTITIEHHPVDMARYPAERIAVIKHRPNTYSFDGMRKGVICGSTPEWTMDYRFGFLGSIRSVHAVEAVIGGTVYDVAYVYPSTQKPASDVLTFINNFCGTWSG